MTSFAERAPEGALVFYPAFACVSPAGAAEPIVIGEINPLTGAFALQGRDIM